MVVLLSAGDQTPVMPLVDVVGSGDKIAPEQIDVTPENVGIVLLLTVTVRVVVEAHCPAFGVKVYVVVTVLFNAGNHIPVIPFVEVVGSGDKGVPKQIGEMALNIGNTG